MAKLLGFKIKRYFKNSRLGKAVIRARDYTRSLRYLYKYYLNNFTTHRLSDIQVISIEFCAICNLRCRYCFLERRHRPSFLPLNIYEKLLKELCENKSYAVKTMEWPVSGCFFLHPQYKEIIEITRAYKEKYPHFRPWIILNDNMMLFDKDKVDFLLRQKVVNQIICSIDGVDKETFEYMRPQAEFEKVLENTRYLLNKNKECGNKVVIQVNNGRDDKCVGREPDLRLKKIFSQAGLLTYWEPLDWNESFHKEKPSYSPYPSFCSFVFESVSLSTSAAITKCCMDLKEATKYGDFNSETLESIWSSQQRREFLRAMYEGKRNLIPGCGTCSINYVRQNKNS